MDRRYMVKQYVAEVQARWCRFRVFETGDARWYLFDQLDRHGCSTMLQFPVLKTDLRREVRRCLRAGVNWEGEPDGRLPKVPVQPAEMGGAT